MAAAICRSWPSSSECLTQETLQGLAGKHVVSRRLTENRQRVSVPPEGSPGHLPQRSSSHANRIFCCSFRSLHAARAGTESALARPPASQGYRNGLCETGVPAVLSLYFQRRWRRSSVCLDTCAASCLGMIRDREVVEEDRHFGRATGGKSLSLRTDLGYQSGWLHRPSMRQGFGQLTGGLAVDTNLGWKGAEKDVAAAPQ